MKRSPILFLLVFPVLLSAALQQRTGSPPLVIANVALIDATGSSPRPGMTVIVRDGRIAAIGKSESTRLPGNAQVIDGRGKFLIPGLWDLHVHVENVPDVFFPLFIATGVTGVREMGLGAPVEQLQQWRSEIASGSRIGPRIVAGQALDGPTNLDPRVIRLSTPEEGRQAVRTIKQRGFDFVKVFSLLPRDIYLAVADETKKQRIPFDGHIQVSVSAAETSDAGQRTIEHFNEIYLACSIREQEIRNRREDLLLRKSLPPAELTRAMAWPPLEELRDGYRPEKAQALFRRFARNRTSHVPTLVMYLKWDILAAGKMGDDPNRRYIPTAWQEGWKPESSRWFQDLSPEALAVFRKRTEGLHIRNLELVREMRRAGVRIGAGTDTSSWNPVVPGFSLHEELELLVEGGLTPMEALQAATRNAAEMLGKLNDLGTVAKGKLADLVLLDANPLESIANTRKVHAVVVNGRLLGREQLDQMLARAEAAR